MRSLGVAPTRCRGLTLVELLIGLAIMAILTVVAAPSLRAMLQSNRAATQANELIGSLNVARSEAITRGLAVSVCASTDGAACGTATQWAQGWILFVDSAGSAGTVDAADTVLRVSPALASGSSLLLTDAAAGADRAFLRFLPSGFLDGTGNQEFQLRVAGCMRDNNRNVTVAPTGRQSVLSVAC